MKWRWGEDERGSILTEAVVAISILAVLVLGMTAALSSGLRSLLTSKQRAAAVHAAAAVVERARAVAATDWTQLGLVSADIAGDTNITTGACGSSPNTPMFADEPVIVAGTQGTNPLYPHISTASIGASTIKLKVYVTGVTASGCSATNPQYKRVTVLGEWERGQSGVVNQVRLVTYVFDAVRSPSLEFEGSATYGAGRLSGTIDDGVALKNTTAFFPQSLGDLRTVGRVQVAKGSGTTTLVQVDDVLANGEHHATSIADDDGLTAIGPGAWPAPNCDSGSWSDFVGGLIGGNVTGTAASCSSVKHQDGLPNSYGEAALTNLAPMVSTIVGGSLPPFQVFNFVSTGGIATESTVDRQLVGSQQRLSSVAEFTSAGVEMLRFTVLGLNASEGALKVMGGAWSAAVTVGQGSLASPVPQPVLTGTITYKVFDPDMVLTGCPLRSGDYCVYTVNPADPAFGGSDVTHTVTMDRAGSRFTITSHVIIPDPITSSTLDGQDVTAAGATYHLPKVSSVMVVESPIGTPVATLSDDADFGQLEASGAFRRP